MIRTKIVCTIGPASRDEATLRKLIEAGMDVARLNLSHSDHAFHAETIARIRAASKEIGKSVAIMGDLQGPKLRIGEMGPQGVTIYEGEHVTLTTSRVVGRRQTTGGIDAVIPIQYRNLTRDIKPGERILIDDGLVELRVDSGSEMDIQCEVLTGGVLTDHKGLNLPGTLLSLPSVTDKDWLDLGFCLEQQLDWVALSFVRSAEDVNLLKEHIAQKCRNNDLVRVIAKIEKPQALEWINEIIEVSDAIMVARGDLGIEIPPENVPLVQKRLIHLSNAAAKPVITATQMLDSMIRNPRPTRAEASDVANAILDGTDAIMLSGETANGKYPLESVRTMVRIATEIENHLAIAPWKAPEYVQIDPGDVTDAVSHATCSTAFDLRAAAILVATASGQTARDVAKYRPHAPIMAATPNPIVERQLRLVWGVVPVLSRPGTSNQIIQDIIDLSVHKGMAREGDRVVVTAGMSANMTGATNMMTVQVIKKRPEPSR